MTEEANTSDFAAQTGAGPTTMVAVEQHFPEKTRILHDDLAHRILPLRIRLFVWLAGLPSVRDWMVRPTEKQALGLWSGMLCRKRYIDEKVAASVAGPIEAVVNLGAGYDTRAYRLPALAKVPIWEVDQPVNIDAKRSRLQKVFGAVPAHVILVPVNFEHEDLRRVLASHGYTGDVPTFFVWEAVTQYLTASGVHATFAFLDNAPAGSRLAFTYVLKDFIEGKAFYDLEPLYKQMVVKDKAWHFGFAPDEVADFLNGYGWRVLEHVSYAELAQRYVQPIGRQLASMEIERLVYAEKF